MPSTQGDHKGEEVVEEVLAVEEGLEKEEQDVVVANKEEQDADLVVEEEMGDVEVDNKVVEDEG